MINGVVETHTYMQSIYVFGAAKNSMNVRQLIMLFRITKKVFAYLKYPIVHAIDQRVEEEKK